MQSETNLGEDSFKNLELNSAQELILYISKLSVWRIAFEVMYRYFQKHLDVCSLSTKCN